MVHVRRHAAGPQMAAGRDDLIEELRNLGNVELGDRLLQFGGGQPSHPGQAAEPLRHVGCGVAQHGELQVGHGVLRDHVEAPEGEEEVGLDALAQGGIGQDQGRVCHVEIALGADDGELAAFTLRVVERRHDGGRSSSTGGVVMAGLLVWCGQTQPCGLGSPATYAIFLAGFWGNSVKSCLTGAPLRCEIRRKVAVSPVSAKSSRSNRTTSQCASVIEMPIWAARAAPSSSVHSAGTVRKPSSLMWNSWPASVVVVMATPSSCVWRHARLGACRPWTCSTATGAGGRGAGCSSRSSGTRASRGGLPGSP